MAAYLAIHDRVLDPFGKKIFDENTRYSQYFLSQELRNLFKVVEQDTILRGLSLSSYHATSNYFHVVYNPGALVHDLNLFEIKTSFTIQFDLYTNYTIYTTNENDNYFEVSGNKISLFPSFTTFAITDGPNQGTNWVVERTEYNSGTNRTKLYVAGNVLADSTQRTMIYRNVKDVNNTTAKLVAYTSFQHLELDNQSGIKFCLDYLKNDGTLANGWSEETNRILLNVFEFTKSSDDTSIITSSFKSLENIPENLFTLNDRTYEVANLTDIAKYTDSGVL